MHYNIPLSNHIKYISAKDDLSVDKLRDEFPNLIKSVKSNLK